MHLRAGWAISSTATSFTSMATTVSQTLTFSFTRQFLVAGHLMQTCNASHEHEGLRTCIPLIYKIEVSITSYSIQCYTKDVAQPTSQYWGKWKMRRNYLLLCQVISAYKVKSLTAQSNLKQRPPDIKCESIDLRDICKLSTRFQSIIFWCRHYEN